MNWSLLTDLKKQLDGFRPMPPELVLNLEQWFKVELTYTSNALEGNTLTRQETAVVLEKGLTVSGKSLVEHLEATNHAKAYEQILELVSEDETSIDEEKILAIHEAILKGIDDPNAGCYRAVMVRISGSQVVLPNPVKVPDLMEEFSSWFQNPGKLHPVEIAAEAHYRLVTIHPFSDGNGRTARLLMNLLLLREGYPPALIRTRDRLRYLQSLEEAQLGGSKEKFYRLIQDAVKRSFDIYLKAVSGDDRPREPEKPLLKIGQIAKQSGQTVPTIRHWVKSGLIDVTDVTASGYQLFEEDALARIKDIQELKSQRYTLEEIRAKLNP